MELFVLQHSEASAVEKLDAIARDYPDLGYMLNAIAIQIIDLQEAAEQHEASLESMDAECKKEIEEFRVEAQATVDDAEDESRDLRDENEKLAQRLDTLEKTDVEALLEENAEILAELDSYRSRHNTMGTADFIKQNEALRSCVHRLSKNMARAACDVRRFTRAYRGKFKDSISACAQAMQNEACDALQAASAMPALAAA